MLIFAHLFFLGFFEHILHHLIEVDIDEFRENMQYAYDKMVSTGAVTQEQVDRMMEIVENARQ